MINRFLIEMCSNLLFISMSWFCIFWPCDISCIKICAIDILGYTWIFYFIRQCPIFFIKFFFTLVYSVVIACIFWVEEKKIYMYVLFPNCMCVVCVLAIFFSWLVFYSIYYLLIFKLFVHYKKIMGSKYLIIYYAFE